QLNSKSDALVCRMHLDRVPADTERSAPEVEVVAVVANLNKLRQNVAPGNTLALLQHQQHAVICLRPSQTVDAGKRSDDVYVARSNYRPAGRAAELVDA